MMAKYRLLTLEELKELEKEFIDYLIINGIAADDWEKMKANNPDNADEFVSLFSNVVFERIMRKTNYLESRKPHELKVFHCLADKMILVGMSAPGQQEIDFTNPDYIQKAIRNPPEGLKIYTCDKKYEKPREVEIFELLQHGYTIAVGNLYKTLCLCLPSNNE